MTTAAKIMKECQLIYEEKGQSAVFNHVNYHIEHGDITYRRVNFEYCYACETDSPAINSTCLVCRQGTKAHKPIRLVVVNEHTLGYIDPMFPRLLNILHASVLKGSPYSNLSGSIHLSHEKVRLASEKDFADFRVLFDGYKGNPDYEYAI